MGLASSAVAGATTRRVTLMYFEGCAPSLLATVVLRGEAPAEMRLLKRMLAASAYIAADLASEASYIYDFGGTTPLPSAALPCTPAVCVADADADADADAAHGGAAVEGTPHSPPAGECTPLAAAQPPASAGSSGVGGTPAPPLTSASSVGTSPPLLSQGQSSSSVGPSISVEEVLGADAHSAGGAAGVDINEGQHASYASSADAPPPPSRALAPGALPGPGPSACIASSGACAAAVGMVVGSGAASRAVGGGTPGASCRSLYLESGAGMASGTLTASALGEALQTSTFARREATDEYFYTAEGLAAETPRAAVAHLACALPGAMPGTIGGERSSAAAMAMAAPAALGRPVGPMTCVVCDEQPADRLWHDDARVLRVATCWKRTDVTEAPCLMPRERALYYDLQVARAASAAADDHETLGQFLRNCFNLRRQCANQKCRESQMRHEQVFSHHGGRFSITVAQLPAEQVMPTDGLYAWSVCRLCPHRKIGPRLPLSPATCALPLGRFLESNFYNTAASARAPGCQHSLHVHHDRYVATNSPSGPLVAVMRLQQCVVFGITPPLHPRDLSAPPPPKPLPLPPPPTAQLSPASAAAAHALSQPATVGEVARGVMAVRGADAGGSLTDAGEGGGGGGGGGSERRGAATSTSGGVAVGALSTHESLCSLMRWTDAQPKIEIRYEDEATDQLLHGVMPVRAIVLYPANFAALRERFCEGGDASFSASLRQAALFDSGRGGKSGSTFLKTLDDRYLLKQVPRNEFWSFHERMPTYFNFVSKTPQILSLLVKVHTLASCSHLARAPLQSRSRPSSPPFIPRAPPRGGTHPPPADHSCGLPRPIRHRCSPPSSSSTGSSTRVSSRRTICSSRRTSSTARRSSACAISRARTATAAARTRTRPCSTRTSSASTTATHCSSPRPPSSG